VSRRKLRMKDRTILRFTCRSLRATETKLLLAVEIDRVEISCSGS
jgi:hypothetical protein